MSLLTSNQTPKKREYTDKQKAFLDEFAFSMDYDLALAAGEYGPRQRYDVTKSLQSEIVNIAEYYLATNSPKAAKQLVDTLNGTAQDFEHSGSKYKAAIEILDRSGIGKQTQVSVQAEVIHGIVLLPSKKDAGNVIDVSPTEG